MKKYAVSLGGEVTVVNADRFRQDGMYVSFYIKAECVGLIRLGDSDAILEIPERETADVQTTQST